MSEIAKKKTSLKDIFRGQFSGDFLVKRLIPSMILLYFLPIFISSLSFSGYSIAFDYISDLGNPSLNPNGWIIWSIGHVLMGLHMFCIGKFLIIMIGNHTISNGKPLFRIASKLGIFFVFVSSLGWLLIGLIPQYNFPGSYEIHVIDAMFLLAGLYLGAFLLGFVVVFTSKMSGKKIASIFFGWVGPIGFIIRSIYLMNIGLSVDSCTDGSCFWYLNFQFWEWILLLGIIFSFIILVAIIGKMYGQK